MEQINLLSTLDIASFGHEPKLSKSEKIKKAAQEFEAVFISEMMKPMFETVETDPLFGGGHAEKVYQSMMITEYGKEIAANGNGIGLQSYIQAQMEAYTNTENNSHIEGVL